MRNVIVCWCKGDENIFELNVPLFLIGKRNNLLGYSADIDLLFLEGLQNLSSRYKDKLKSLGYKFYDVSTIFTEEKKKHQTLLRFGDFELKCFLRWNVLDEFYKNHSIIHYDGDVVFNTDPNYFLRVFEHLTFVLQGCPAFTVINNMDWFAQYKHHLNLFSKNIEHYSAIAWEQRIGWEESYTGKWAGSRFRETISSDQDLLSHLIHTDQIFQSSVSDINALLNDYMIFENPLEIHLEVSDKNLIYSRKENIDYINDKRVALWHMQSEFVNYLSRFLIRKLVFNENNQLSREIGKIEKYVNYFLRETKFMSFFSRKKVYEHFFIREDFNEVFNNNLWWIENVFK